jgi:superfamily II DNA or RNA helicase
MNHRGYQADDLVKLEEGVRLMLKLRPDQIELKNAIYKLIHEEKNTIAVQAMTSFGKTAVMASIVQDALSRGLGVICTAPMITLVDQMVSELGKWGIRSQDIGVIQADHYLTDYSKPVQICSIQTIASILKKDPLGWSHFQSGKLIIHDECHIQHEAHKKMNEIADKPVIGFSATPWRSGLGKEYQALVNGPDTRWLIEKGFLSNYRAYSHYVPDLKGISVGQNGDYSLSETGDKYEPKVIGSIVSTWKKHALGRKTILFAPRVADAERFAQEFIREGIAAVSISGYMDSEDCAKEIDRFRNGEITILCSVSKLATGFSVSDVGCIIDAQPTKSLMRHVQKLGRGLRTHPGKDDLIILDNAGNLLRNGLPDSDFPTELCNGNEQVSVDRRKSEDALPKPCSSCNFVKPPGVTVCPSCGFETRTQSTLEVEPGELIELANDKNQKQANRVMCWSDKIEFAAQLKGYAKLNGYKKGWVAHQYKGKFGVWPNDQRVKLAPPKSPGDLVYNWIKHQVIKSSHSRPAA